MRLEQLNPPTSRLTPSTMYPTLAIPAPSTTLDAGITHHG
jgi:hypothetical protein